MSEPKKDASSRLIAGYALLLALHRYAKWVSSLQSARPASVLLAEREIRLITTLRDEHFRAIARQLNDLGQRHRSLVEAVESSDASDDHASWRLIDPMSQAASQAEAVNRLVSLVERYLSAPSAPPSSGVVVDTPVLPRISEQPAAPR